MYFRFFLSNLITYDGFEHGKMEQVTLFYRERQHLESISFERLDFHHKIDHSAFEASVFQR